jgi:hypothetical protein
MIQSLIDAYLSAHVQRDAAVRLYELQQALVIQAAANIHNNMERDRVKRGPE